MSKSRKVVSLAAVGVLLSAIAIGLATHANAATSYESIYSRIINKLNTKKTTRSSRIVPGTNYQYSLPALPTDTKSQPVVAEPEPVQTPAQPIEQPAEKPVPAPVQAPVSEPQTSLPSASSSSKMWGAYLSDSNASSFESLVGKQMDIQAYFYGWGDAFPSSSSLKSQGKTIFIFWEQYGVALDSIISGSQDAYIKQFAEQAKAYGGPVMLAPFHEMNGDWDPWGGTVGSNTPAKVVSAWKHVRDLFSSASNVKFVWAVNNASVPDTSENAISNYWPGASYVDYVGIDGFNFGSQWSYDSVFSGALQQVRGYGKPILISSTASAAGSQKASWITDTLNQIYKDPNIKGFIWFNENKEQNWLVNSDPSSLQAFKTAIQQY